ncbi:MAG: tetratricopeptide repeat protein, partial [Spirochaetota bacterium]
HGYRDARRTLDPGAGGVERLHFDLEPDFVLTGFPEEDSVVRLRGTFAAGSFVRLPPGDYSIERRDARVIVTPRYRHEGWISGLTVAGGVALGLTVLSFLADQVAQPLARVSPVTVASGVSVLGLVAADALLIADRARFYSSLDPVILDGDPLEAALLLERADLALEAGRLAVALEALDEYVARSPNGAFVAESLYRQARVLVSLGDHAGAIDNYRSLIDDYPEAEFYDRAIMGLSEALDRDGRPGEALDALDRITFVAATPTREEVAVMRMELVESRYLLTGEGGDERAEGWLSIARRLRDSVDSALYLLRAAEALVDAGRPAEAEAVLEEIGSLDPALERLRDLIRDRIERYE